MTFNSNGEVQAQQKPAGKICPKGTYKDASQLTASARQSLSLLSEGQSKNYTRSLEDFENLSSGKGCELARYQYEGRNIVYSQSGEIIYKPPGLDPLTGRVTVKTKAETSYEWPVGRVTLNESTPTMHSDYDCSKMNDDELKQYMVRFKRAQSDLEDAAAEYESTQAQLGNLVHNGSNLHLPILNLDATEFAATDHGTTRIFEIEEGGTCKLVRNLGYNTGKLNFSHPQKGKKGRLAFGDENRNIRVLDRDKNILANLTEEEDQEPTLASYPGFTRDGRIMFMVFRDGKNQLVWIDPNQVDPRLGPCITTDDFDALDDTQSKI